MVVDISESPEFGFEPNRSTRKATSTQELTGLFNVGKAIQYVHVNSSQVDDQDGDKVDAWFPHRSSDIGFQLQPTRPDSSPTTDPLLIFRVVFGRFESILSRLRVAT